jgi:hypothetical protein
MEHAETIRAMSIQDAPRAGGTLRGCYGRPTGALLFRETTQRRNSKQRSKLFGRYRKILKWTYGRIGILYGMEMRQNMYRGNGKRNVKWGKAEDYGTDNTETRQTAIDFIMAL